MAKKCAPSEFTAYVGIDWGDKEHSVSLQAAGQMKVERWKVKHSPEKLES